METRGFPVPRKRIARAELSRARVALFLSVLLLAIGCAKRLPFDKEKARLLIEESSSWRGPAAPEVYVDPRFRPSPTTRRDLLRVVTGDAKRGLLGIGGETATAVFTWRWLEGYPRGKVFQSKAAFSNTSDGWRVDDDLLRKTLWAAERAEGERNGGGDRSGSRD